MARLIFYPVAAPTGALVRFDSASGTDTPAAISPLGRESVTIPGSTLIAGRRTGNLPAIVGPDGVTTLYQKVLNYAASATGGVLATLTGVAQAVPVPTGGSSNSNTPYGLSGIGYGDYRVPVGLRTHVAFDASDILTTQVTFQNFQPLSDPAVDSVLPIYGNQGVSTSGGAVDLAAPNSIDVATSVVTSDGLNIPFTFLGQHFFTIPAYGGMYARPDNPLPFGAQVSANDKYGVPIPRTGVNLRVTVRVLAPRSDSVTTTSGSPVVNDASIVATDAGRKVAATGIPANSYIASVIVGTSFRISSSPTGPVDVNATASATVTATISSQIPLNIGPYASTDAASLNNAVDGTLLGAAAPSGGSFSYHYGPMLVLGRSRLTTIPILGLAGDSIPDGYQDDFHSPYMGPFGRACIIKGMPFVKVARGGETAASFAAPLSRGFRTLALEGSTDVMLSYGTNDGINSSGQVTNTMNRLIAVGQFVVGIGAKPHISTVPPRTSSADQWMTPEGQTAISVIVNLASLNSQIRALPAPFVKLYDLEALCSSAQDSGVWGNITVRTDTMGITASSNAITDTSITAADAGRLVVGTGIPYPSYVGTGTVSVGVGFTLSSTSATSTPVNATATNAAAAVTIKKAKTVDGVHPIDEISRGSMTDAATTFVNSL